MDKLGMNFSYKKNQTHWVVSVHKLLSIALFWVVIASYFSINTSAYAALDLELTQGVDAAIPIAVVPFVNEQSNLPGQETLSQVIRRDLGNSGQFVVKTANNKNTADDLSYWQHQKVDAVLQGQIKTMTDGRYQVSFRLLSVFNQNKQEGNQEAPLLAQQYQVAQAGLRRLAHHISDLVYHKLIGVRGVFSTKVAYVLVQPHPHQLTEYSLEVSDIDGFNPHTLLKSTQPIMSPAWSPDGQHIAYVSFEGNRASIYLQELATGMRRQLIHYPGVNGAPAFSPDGQRLAVVLTLAGSPNIYIYHLSTGKLQQITHGYSIDTEPAWAADGNSLVFTSNRGGTPQIYRYSFAGGTIERLSFEGNYNARASFALGGQSLVMMHRETGLFGIASERLDSGQVEVLTQTGLDESPSVSPNGRMVIYATQYGGRGVLALVSMDGGIKLRLPAREGDVREPAWSPFL